MTKTLFAICSLLLACCAQAATYYLDNTATGANNGTSWANAWKNFASVPGSLAAGSIVYISGGASGQTYAGEQFPHTGGGVKGNPIIFRVGQDSAHSGMVTFDRGSLPSNYQWMYAASTKPISWITIDGDVDDSCHIQLTNWGVSCVLDGGATGIVFRYIKAQGISGSCQFRAYQCDYMELDHCLIGPDNGVDRNIVGIGTDSPTNSYDTNSIHDCTILAYYIHGVNSIGGNGDDFIGNVGCITIAHNNFIGVHMVPESNFTTNQHQDGIQSGYNWVKVDGNYFENNANYCVYVDYETGGGGNWVIVNNVINYADGALTKQPSVGIAWGAKVAARMSNITIANNTVFGGGIGIGNNISTNTFSNVKIANNLCYGQNTSSFTLAAPATGVSMLCNKSDKSMVPPNSQPPANNNKPTWVNPTGAYPDVHYGSSNFQLAANDTGATANGTNAVADVFNYDALGNPRPSGNWALGAYEPTGGGPGPTPTPTPAPTPTPTPVPTPTPTPTPVPTPTPTPSPTPGPSPSPTPIVIVVPYPSTITIQPHS